MPTILTIVLINTLIGALCLCYIMGTETPQSRWSFSVLKLSLPSGPSAWIMALFVSMSATPFFILVLIRRTITEMRRSR